MNKELRTNELRYSDALPYLKWIVNALDGELPQNWTNRQSYLERALINAKEYIKTTEV